MLVVIDTINQLISFMKKFRLIKSDIEDDFDRLKQAFFLQRILDLKKNYYNRILLTDYLTRQLNN